MQYHSQFTDLPSPTKVKELSKSPLSRFKDIDRNELKKITIDIMTQADWPLRSNELITQDILKGLRISALERLSLVSSYKYWVKIRKIKHPGFSNKAQAVSYLLIKLMIDHNISLNFYIWKSLHAKKEYNDQNSQNISQESAYFPKEIMTAIFKSKASNKLKYFKWLYDEDYEQIVEYLLQSKMTLNKFLMNFNVPIMNSIYSKSMEYIMKNYLMLDHKQQLQEEKWFVECLNDLKLDVRQSATDSLLQKISEDALTRLKHLQNKLNEWYPINSSAYYELSTASQQKIQQFHILKTWNVLEGIIEEKFTYTIDQGIDVLVGQDFVRQGTDTTKKIQARHALSRLGIWSNYTSQIREIRIIIPASMKEEISHILQDKIKQDGKFIFADIMTPFILISLSQYTLAFYVWGLDKSSGNNQYSQLKFFTSSVFNDIQSSHILNSQSLNKFTLSFNEYKNSIVKEVQVTGKLWQPNLCETIQGLNIKENEGLKEFRGIASRFLQKRGKDEGMPRGMNRSTYYDHD